MRVFKCFLSVFLTLLLVSCSDQPQKFQLTGKVFGTNYQVVYLANESVIDKDELQVVFDAFNQSLSTYIPTSTISQLNNQKRNEIEIDTFFAEVLDKSLTVYNRTNGYYDPTIGKLVKVWGFGPKGGATSLSKKQIDSIMQYVGMDHLHWSNGVLVKDSPEIELDFNALAKGFGIDVVGRILENKGLDNYLIEIGGEIRARGTNDKSQYWRVGIEKPEEGLSRSIQEVVSLNNESMATSGNYRKFRVNKTTGEKFVHTVDPKTGFAQQNDLLSATVIGSGDCAELDGYATALMAMGFKKAQQFFTKNEELKGYLVYLDNENTVQIWKTPNFE